jgi:hypothetical protein
VSSESAKLVAGFGSSIIERLITELGASQTDAFPQ